MRKFTVGILIAVCAIFAVTVGNASAGGGSGVSIVHDYGVGNCDPVYAGSPCFMPNPADPGSQSTLTLTVSQTNPSPNAVVTINTHTSDLSFVSNGDGSASCSTTGNKTTCIYSDFAHGYKSDSYTFAVSSSATPGEIITSNIHVETGSGNASTSSDLEITPPAGTPSAPIIPAVLKQVDHVGACASVPVVRAADGSKGIFIDLTDDAYASGEYQGVSFTAANYFAGKGLTCDNPTGFTDAGYKVDGSGTVNGNPVGNLYEYYTVSK